MNESVLIRSLQEFDAFVPEWRQFLQQHADHATVFQDPALVRLEIESGQAGELLIIGVRRDGKLRCVAPFHVVTETFPLRLGVVRLAGFRARVLRLFGDRVISAATGDVEGDLDQVFGRLAALGGEFDLCAVSSVPCDGPLWRYFGGGQRRRCGFSLRRTTFKGAIVRQLRLQGSFEDYLQTMKRKTRYNLNRSVKKFIEATGGTARFSTISEPGQVASFLRDLDCVYARSWQARTFGYQPRHTPREEARLLEAARHGWLRSYLLACEQGPVAFVLGFQYDGVYDYHEIGFDSDWRAHSPGNVLNMYLLEDLFARDRPQVLDFGFGENDYKRIFGNHAFEASNIYLLKPGINRGSLLVRSQYRLSRLYTALHTLATRLGLDAWLRKVLKHR